MVGLSNRTPSEQWVCFRPRKAPSNAAWRKRTSLSGTSINGRVRPPDVCFVESRVSRISAGCRPYSYGGSALRISSVTAPRAVVAIHTVHNLAEHETDSFGRLVHRFAFRNRVLPIGISQEVSASVKRIYGLECKAVIPNRIPVGNYRHKSGNRRQWREQTAKPGRGGIYMCRTSGTPKKPSPALASFRGN